MTSATRSGGGPANRREGFDVERGAADERAVDAGWASSSAAFSGLTEPP